jgi:hypothetical protein
MKNSENAAIPASAISMLSGLHCRPSGKDAHARRNPFNKSSRIRIPQVHHFPGKNGVTSQVPTVRTAAAPKAGLRLLSACATVDDAAFQLRLSEDSAPVEESAVGERPVEALPAHTSSASLLDAAKAPAFEPRD